MFKVSKGLCPQIVEGLFQYRNDIPYKLRQRSQFHIPPVRTVFSGTESIKFLGPKIWELIPDEMKKLESKWEFKRAIKLWKPVSYSCRLCKQYFYGILNFNLLEISLYISLYIYRRYTYQIVNNCNSLTVLNM